MRFLDRLLTILITATLTSAVWIVAGGTLMERAANFGAGAGATTPAPAGPAADGSPASASRAGAGKTTAAVPHSDVAAVPPGDLAIPVAGVRAADLTDTFTDSRAGGERLHEAIDIMAPRGTAVIAAAPGRVEKLFQSDAGGNTVYVRSTDGQTVYYYAHLDTYAPGLAEGQTIARGKPIGTVGSTGNAAPDAPHLHFAIMRTTPTAQWWEPAAAMNPYPVLAGR